MRSPLERHPIASVVLGTLVFVALLLLPSIARADDVPITLSWTAPDECPKEADVLAEARRLLGAPSELDKAVAARAIVRRAVGVWRVEITTESEGMRGRRSFRARACDDLANATALVLALLVNPDKAVDPTGRVLEDPPAPPPPATPAPVVTEAPQVAPSHRFRFQAGLLGVADIGTLPEVGWSVAAFGGIALGRLRVALSGGVAPGHDVPLGRPGVGGIFTKVAVGPRVCFALTSGTLETSLCASEELNYLHASSYGIASPRSASTTWVESLVGGSTTLFLNRVMGLRLEAFAGFPWPRRRFVIDLLGPVHEVPVLTGRIGVGAEMRF